MKKKVQFFLRIQTGNQSKHLAFAIRFFYFVFLVSLVDILQDLKQFKVEIFEVPYLIVLFISFLQVGLEFERLLIKIVVYLMIALVLV